MKIAIRMDDITPCMDWEKFEEVKKLLEEYRVKPLIGVVPDNKDSNLNRAGDNMTGRSSGQEEFWCCVKELQEKGWVIAQHGYQHRYTEKKGGLFPLNRFSEFAGLPYEKQCKMIGTGREILLSHGIQTDIFMAPAHSYDRNTIRALKDNGFSKMTDGFGKRPYIMDGMKFYPISFRLQSSLKQKKGITTMVIHSNTVNQKDMVRYREIFKNEEVISYQDYLEESASPRKIPGRMAEYMLACIKHMLVKLL